MQLTREEKILNLFFIDRIFGEERNDKRDRNESMNTLGQKKTPVKTGVKKNLAATYSPYILLQVPLATRGLTAEFGMGSGVSLSL